MEVTENIKKGKNFEIDLKPGGFFTSGHFRISGTKEQVDEFFKEQEEEERKDIEEEYKSYKYIFIATLIMIFVSLIFYYVVEHYRNHYISNRTNTHQTYKEINKSPVIGNKVYYPKYYQAHDSGSSSNGFFLPLIAHFDKKNSPCHTMEQKPTNSKAVNHANNSVNGWFCEAKRLGKYTRAIMPQGYKKEWAVGQNGQSVMFHFLINRVKEQNCFTHSLLV